MIFLILCLLNTNVIYERQFRDTTNGNLLIEHIRGNQRVIDDIIIDDFTVQYRIFLRIDKRLQRIEKKLRQLDLWQGKVINLIDTAGMQEIWFKLKDSLKIDDMRIK
jgi:hypothetical protein